MNELRRACSPAFLAAAGLLFLAAAGVHGVVWSQGMHLIKREVPLRQPLFLIDRAFGPYERVGEQRLSAEMLEELGTERHILWTFEDATADRRGEQVQLLLAYHSGMPESRPRVSDRVHLIAGLAEGEPDCRPLALPRRLSGDAAELVDDQASLCVGLFLPPAERRAVPVAYAYLVNGRFVASPAEVHAALTDPHVPYAWWAKLEVRVEGLDAPAEQRAAAERFLAHALPAIAAALPAAGEKTRADGGEPPPGPAGAN